MTEQNFQRQGSDIYTPGAILRQNGQGLAVAGTSGDLFVEIKVTLPKTLTDEQRKILEGWGE